MHSRAGLPQVPGSAQPLRAQGPKPFPSCIHPGVVWEQVRPGCCCERQLGGRGGSPQARDPGSSGPPAGPGQFRVQTSGSPLNRATLAELGEIPREDRRGVLSWPLARGRSVLAVNVFPRCFRKGFSLGWHGDSGWDGTCVCRVQRAQRAARAQRSSAASHANGTQPLAPPGRRKGGHSGTYGGPDLRLHLGLLVAVPPAVREPYSSTIWRQEPLEKKNPINLNGTCFRLNLRNCGQKFL